MTSDPTAWHLAQMNVARALYPLEHPGMSGFMERLDEINALAEASPGFVWRLQSDSGNATEIQVSDDAQFIVNLSVWSDIDSLFDYVYRTAHTKVMAQRRQWFERSDKPHMVLWWVPAGRYPSPQEGMEKLADLDANGPGPLAFTFKQRFAPPSNDVEVSDALAG